MFPTVLMHNFPLSPWHLSPVKVSLSPLKGSINTIKEDNSYLKSNKKLTSINKFLHPQNLYETNLKLFNALNTICFDFAYIPLFS